MKDQQAQPITLPTETFDEDSSMRKEKQSMKDYLSIIGPVALLCLLVFFAAFQFVDPAPPKKFSIATARQDGAYYQFALRYQEILKRQGIELEILESAGSIANLKLLQTPGNKIDVAFVQGGTAQAGVNSELQSIASLYFEPLWVFYRTEHALTSLRDVLGKRLAIGAPGSGTRAVASQLLAVNGINISNTELLPLGGREAIDALVQGQVEASFIVGALQSSAVRELLSNPKISLLSFDRANAYTRSYRFLSSVTLPQGVIDFEHNLPERNITLLAPTANLVITPELHPALIDLLLQAATQVHGHGRMFETSGQFPSARYLDFPISEEAQRFFKSGPPFLQRFLPFWIATFVDRMLVMLLPMIVILIPLLRLMPPMYRWRIRSRIYRWYRDLLTLDPAVNQHLDRDALQQCMEKLNRIELEITRINVPLSYADQLYQLRVHIELVRDNLHKALNNT